MTRGLAVTQFIPSEAASGFQVSQVLFTSQQDSFSALAFPSGVPTHVPHPGTEAGHAQQFHVYFQKVMKTKEIYPDTTLHTINSLPHSKKRKKNQKRVCAHTQPAPKLCFSRWAPSPLPSPFLRTPLSLSGWGPGQLPKVPGVLCLTLAGWLIENPCIFIFRSGINTDTNKNAQSYSIKEESFQF